MSPHRPTAARLGFTYRIEVEHADGRIERDAPVHNLLPAEGIAHMLGVTFKGAAQVPTWYIALFEGDYEPSPTTTAATFPAEATECTAYTALQRVEFVEGAIAAGEIDNAASRAEFTMTSARTVYGGALLSSPVKGGGSGIAMSLVRFASPKKLEAGATLRVIAGTSLVSID